MERSWQRDKIALMVSLVFPMRMSEEDEEAGGETASDADRGRDID